MREIKFRAWNKKKKEMHKVMSISFDMEYIDCNEARRKGSNVSFVESNLLIDFKNSELMEYTGFRDSKNNEIYEGDILRWLNWQQEATDKADIYVIFYKPPSFVWNCYRGGELLQPASEPLNETEEFEIVGNIYETPELLR